MLEPMSEFFEHRLAGYDEHMLNNIESARQFYPLTASQLPRTPGVRILDLGCGTGLELEEYFRLQPQAQVTGIDLSQGMLDALRRKFPHQPMTLIRGSYFDVPFGDACFDAAVSVESLHHFTMAEKIPLYTRLRHALTSEGYFVLTDYFSATDDEEAMHRQNLARLMKEQNIQPGKMYHYDTPLTLRHEQQALLQAAFTTVDIVQSWGATTLLIAR